MRMGWSIPMCAAVGVANFFQGIQFNVLKRPSSRRDVLQRLTIVALMALAGLGAYLVGGGSTDISKVAGDSFLAQLTELDDSRAELALLQADDGADPARIQTLEALIGELERVKPAAAKGRYVKKVVLSTTMGPGVRVEPAEIAED